MGGCSHAPCGRPRTVARPSSGLALSLQVDYWKTSKQLAHGSLIALWFEPRSAEDPRLIFATVADRDARKLAGSYHSASAASSSSSSRNGATTRCMLGLSLQHQRDSELLVQA